MIFAMFLLIAGVLVALPSAATNLKHIRQTTTIELDAPIERVFPLFGPVRESEWAADWKPAFIHQPDPEGGEGAVWRTGHDGVDQLWTLARWDAERHEVTYVTVVAGERLTRIDIRCVAAARAKTRCEIAYAYTALGPKGEEYIASYTAERHANRIVHWQQAITHLLTTGKRME